MSLNVVNKTDGSLTQVAGTAGTAASRITFDDTQSSLGSGNVQGAIDNLTTIVNTKQASTDNTLTTTAKTVVGAINELESGLTKVKHQFSLDGITNAYTGDMDDLYDTGCYWCASNTNLPTGQWYIVFVCNPYIDASGAISAQIAICFTSANVGKTYSRIKGANGWTTWSSLN